MNYYSSSPRVFFGGPVTRTVKILIIINVVVFLVQWLSESLGSQLVVALLGLIPYRVTHDLWVWQLATYMFLHSGVFHIFFNMLTLFMFGNDLERYWGTRRFLNYYFITGIGAGVCSWLISMHSIAATIGASGAIYGLLLAYGLLYPNRIVYLNFLLPVKVKWLVIIMGGMAFFSSLAGGEPGVAHIAHLGDAGRLGLPEGEGLAGPIPGVPRQQEARAVEEALRSVLRRGPAQGRGGQEEGPDHPLNPISYIRRTPSCPNRKSTSSHSIREPPVPKPSSSTT
jgi:membrane associated rhomboid family serine protease